MSIAKQFTEAAGGLVPVQPDPRATHTDAHAGTRTSGPIARVTRAQCRDPTQTTQPDSGFSEKGDYS